jgi:hypothetical protein
MNKYYVVSGSAQKIILAEDELRAAIKFMKMLTLEDVITGTIIISQRGFEIFNHEVEEDYAISLEALLQIMAAANDKNFSPKEGWTDEEFGV